MGVMQGGGERLYTGRTLKDAPRIQSQVRMCQRF